MREKPSSPGMPMSETRMSGRWEPRRVRASGAGGGDEDGGCAVFFEETFDE